MPAGAADVLQAFQADAGEEIPPGSQDAGAAGEHPPPQDRQLQVSSNLTTSLGLSITLQVSSFLRRIANCW